MAQFHFLQLFHVQFSIIILKLIYFDAAYCGIHSILNEKEQKNPKKTTNNNNNKNKQANKQKNSYFDGVNVF